MRKDAVTAATQNMMSLTLRMSPVCAVAISTNSRHGRHILNTSRSQTSRKSAFRNFTFISIAPRATMMNIGAMIFRL